MTITAITPQVRRAGRFSIFIDGEFAFGVNEEQLISLGFRQNQTLSEQEVRKAEQRLEFDTVKQSALRSLELRLHSESELRDKLHRKDFDSALIDDVITWLKEHRFVDDRFFAESWIHSRRRVKGLGSHRLRQELFKKGIAKDIVEDSLKSLPESEEEEVARTTDWVRRRYALSVTKLSDRVTREKVITAIIRRGFSYSVAKKVIDRLSFEKDDLR